MQRSFSNAMWRIFFLIIFHNRDVIGLSRHPENVCVSSNDTALMTCSVSSAETIHWYGYRNGEPERRSLTKANNLNRDYNHYYEIINTLPGQFDLLINSSVLDSAMAYVCLEPEKAEKSSAELVIVGGDLNINPAVKNVGETTHYNLSCSVIVAGNWLPRLRWFSNGAEVNGKEVEQELQGSSTKLTKRLFVEINSSDAECITYTCLLSLDESDRPKDTTASNVPGCKRNSSISLFCTGDPTEQHDSVPSSGNSTIIIVIVVVVALVAIIGSISAILIKHLLKEHGKNNPPATPV